MKTPRRQSERAFTLLEALLAAVILAMAVAAIAMPFTAGAQNEMADARRTLAVALAQDLMEEILAKPFYDDQGATTLGPDGGERSRAQFDNIDDYHGLTEAPGTIAGADGRIISDPAAVGLSRDVQVAYVYVSGQDTSKPATLVRVIVTVRYHGDPVVTLTRMVYAMM